MTMENVLITGITGRSGAYFCREILAEPRVFEQCAVSVVARNRKKIESLLAGDGRINVAYADIDDQAAMERVFTEGRVTTLFHIAGIRHSSELVKTALRCGVERFVLVHTTGIFSKYRNAADGYRKIEAEIGRAVRGRAELTILRPTMIYGSVNDCNISRFIGWVDRFRFFPVVDGGAFALQPVLQRDLGRAYLQVLLARAAARDKNYNLSGAAAVDLIDILRHMSMFLGKRTVFFPVPFRLAYAVALCAHWATLGKVDYRERVQRLVEPRAFSHDEARRDFGYAPSDFYDGLKTEVDEYIRRKMSKE